MLLFSLILLTYNAALISAKLFQLGNSHLHLPALRFQLFQHSRSYTGATLKLSEWLVGAQQVVWYQYLLWDRQTISPLWGERTLRSDAECYFKAWNQELCQEESNLLWESLIARYCFALNIYWTKLHCIYCCFFRMYFLFVLTRWSNLSMAVEFHPVMSKPSPASCLVNKTKNLKKIMLQL